MGSTTLGDHNGSKVRDDGVYTAHAREWDETYAKFASKLDDWWGDWEYWEEDAMRDWSDWDWDLNKEYQEKPSSPKDLGLATSAATTRKDPINWGESYVLPIPLPRF